MLVRVFPHVLQALGWAGALVGSVCFAALLSPACRSAPDEDPATRAEVAPAPPPPGPPCAEEACEERLARLVCVSGFGGYFCPEYRIEYERRCECVRRAGDPEPPAPPVVLGAAPCAEDLCEDRTAWQKTGGADPGVQVDYERRCSCFWPSAVAADGGAP